MSEWIISKDTISARPNTSVDDDGIITSTKDVANDKRGIDVNVLSAASGSINLNIIDKGFLDYGSTNVTSSTAVELIASTSAAVKRIILVDHSGALMSLRSGAGNGTEIVPIPRGGVELDAAIPAGTRISVIAESTTASNNELTYILLG